MSNWSATLYNYWQLTRASLLYVPILFCLGFVAVGIGLFQLDLHLKSFLAGRRFIYGGSIEEAEDLFGLLLSAMITMATLVVSITMVVLSLSASQLGPRIVRVFMDDLRTKIYFGIFFGTIALCFTCIAILHDSIVSDFTPRLTISFAFLICFINLFVLLAYVNHVGQSIGADSIIARLTRELHGSVERLVRKNGGIKGRRSPPYEDHFREISDYSARDLYSFASGYIQSIQYDCLLEVAQERDVFIRLDYKPGDYLITGQTIGCVYSRLNEDDIPALFKNVWKNILTGEYRSATQDIEFSLRHMVEIALRALSPGINDCFTAITVLDNLTGVLAHLFTVSLPVYSLKGDDGRLRVSACSPDEVDIVLTALSEILHAGQSQRIILENAIENIAALMCVANNSDERKALALQVKLIQMHIKAHFSGTPIGKLLQDKLHDHGLV